MHLLRERRVNAGPALLLFALAAFPAGAQTLELALPLRCTPGVDCWIVHHVDQDPGPGKRDHACGTLTYDGHDGIDFALPDLSAMARGVEVLAAADGTVVAVRDGEPDERVESRGLEAVRGRECGNGVLLDHGDGWRTQYCHLRRGSLRVERGRNVRAGETLGLVGLSGKTSFSHLHFEVLRERRSLDPFTGAPVGEGSCPASGPGLWRADVAASLAYVAIPLTGLGVAGREPKPAELERGEHDGAALPADAAALVVWARGFGLRKGDIWRFRLLDPAGRTVVEREIEQDRDQAFAIRWVGRRRPPEGWPIGTYRASVDVRRGEQRFSRERAIAILAP
ncbi:MAG: M23 family metallopeptidase [Geminicoccaceae bacterium]|nr:M23 family metallopeptidase [Geminicoccaceae bacterium]